MKLLQSFMLRIKFIEKKSILNENDLFLEVYEIIS